MPVEPWRVEKVYLLPFPLRKAQFGAWWAAALDEGLVNYGECFWGVDLCLDPQQWSLARPDHPVPAAWHPTGEQQLGAPATWQLQPGCVLGFQNMEGVLLEFTARAGRDLIFFGIDARCFDETLRWKSHASRDRVLRVFARALPEQAPAPVVIPVTPAADRREREAALLELLRKR